MTVGDGIIVAAFCFSVCLYRYIELKYLHILRRKRLEQLEQEQAGL